MKDVNDISENKKFEFPTAHEGFSKRGLKPLKSLVVVYFVVEVGV